MNIAKCVIPDRINVGYNNKSDTYTGKLGYVIYFDEKGELRKQNSWDGWRDHKLGNDIYDNVPTEGFVINKKVGGVSGYSSWYEHDRIEKVRIYDPRGFEFEITIPNLFKIMETNDCLAGKGITGEFVYGWDGTELALIPCNCSEYEEIKKNRERRFVVAEQHTIKTKDLIVGHNYETANSNKSYYNPYTYMGRLENSDGKKVHLFVGQTNYKNSENRYEYLATSSVSSQKLKHIGIADADDYAKKVQYISHSRTYHKNFNIEFTEGSVAILEADVIIKELEDRLNNGRDWRFFYDVRLGAYNGSKKLLEFSGNYARETKFVFPFVQGENESDINFIMRVVNGVKSAKETPNGSAKQINVKTISFSDGVKMFDNHTRYGDYRGEGYFCSYSEFATELLKEKGYVPQHE